MLHIYTIALRATVLRTDHRVLAQAPYEEASDGSGRLVIFLDEHDDVRESVSSNKKMKSLWMTNLFD